MFATRIRSARLHAGCLACGGILAIVLFGSSPAWAQDAAPGDGQVAIDAQPGKGLTLEKEGQFELRLRSRFQLRETLEDRTGSLASEKLVRRARVGLSGYVFDEDLRYKLELGFAPRDLDSTGSPVLDAWIDWAAGRDLAFRIGQQKVHFDRQTIISSSELQFVDRATVIGSFQLDRDIGIALHSEDLFGLDGRLAYVLGVYGGEGRGRLAAPAGFLYLARVEVKPFGDFDAWVEADLERSKRARLSIGGAVAWNEDAVRTFGNRGAPVAEALGLEAFAGFDYLHLEADAIFKWSGLSILAEFLWQRAQDEARVAEVDGERIVVRPHDGWGWFAQAGQMIGSHAEIVARYAEQHAREGASAELAADFADAGRSIGGGANWYLHGHAMKLQADWFRHWGVGQAGFDRRSFADGIDEVRVQLQVTF